MGSLGQGGWLLGHQPGGDVWRPRSLCRRYRAHAVWCPQEQDAVLEMGCDDAIKAWVNGKLVYDEWTEHAAAPRQHRAEVHLKQGWNDVMLKVVDASGGWVAACRVRAPNGLAIDGLKVEAK